MIISYNSQLGLRFNTLEVQIEFLKKMIEVNKDLAVAHTKLKDIVEKSAKDDMGNMSIILPEDLKFLMDDNELDNTGNIIYKLKSERSVRDNVTASIGDQSIIEDLGTKYFFICESVYHAAELIRIGENFTGRTLKDIKFGRYTYLMGKNKMVRFIVGIGVIKGFYYNDDENIAFEWGIEMETGGYYFDGDNHKIFSVIMQVLTFVELGDIEVVELLAGRNNGLSKKSGKVANTSNNTVFVVDSSWNKLIIRTDGFAVRGHFRLQPCGNGMADRKLIWINAFEKHGYRRTARAEIIHS